MKIYIKDNCVSQILITVVVHSIGEEPLKQEGDFMDDYMHQVS